jgi:hypothetical protein
MPDHPAPASGPSSKSAQNDASRFAENGVLASAAPGASGAASPIPVPPESGAALVPNDAHAIARRARTEAAAPPTAVAQRRIIRSAPSREK